MTATLDPVSDERAANRDDAHGDGAPAAHIALTQALIDTEHPWLGLASFTAETRGYFHGREEEVAELCRRVRRKLLTILFGQSGLGKTSILQAGVVPRLGPEGYCPVYVRIDYSPESAPPTEQIKQAIFRATEASGQWTQPGTSTAGESLWEFLHHRDDVLRDETGRTLTPLLIFDQFEEIFTLAQDDAFGRERAARFIEDLADLVENRPPRALESRLESDDAMLEKFDFARADYRILIALREDYLAHLEGLKGAMPSITQNRMRLARMTGDQALAAVVKPGGKLVSDEVAAAIVRFVAGGAELRNAEVEPSLLSLVCRELNNARLAQGRDEISASLLAGSRENILNEFYERSLIDQPAAVRRFIEDEMLTESGFRESLAEERVAKAFAAAGAPAGTLGTLVNRRLLRIEERLDVRRVELTHDVLCGVVLASRDLRHEREARDEAERQLAEQKAREIATHKSLVRARQVAAGCAVLAIVSIASAIFGYQNMQRAKQAEARAEGVQRMAQAARGEAEKLLVFLLDDFYRELEPIGRLDVVVALASRAMDYYRTLPPELRDAGTDRNRALAQVRYGAALRLQNNLEPADAALSEAAGTLRKLRADGDKGEATAIGLALGLSSLARVRHYSSGRDFGIPEAEEAAAVMRPLGSAPDASTAVLRAQGWAMSQLGFIQGARGRDEEAIATLRIARDAWRGVDGLKDDMAAAAGYGEATAWMTMGLQQLGRREEGRKVAAEAVPVLTRILDVRPGHMGALRSRGLLQSGQVDLAWDELDIPRAIGYGQAASRDWQSLLRVDPGNSIARQNLAGQQVGIGYMLWRMGRPEDARQTMISALNAEEKTLAPGLAGIFAFWHGILAWVHLDRGDIAAAENAIARRERLQAIFRNSLPAQSFMRDATPERVVHDRILVAMATRNYTKARDLAQGMAERTTRFIPKDTADERARNYLLAQAYYGLGSAQYELKQYTAAEAALRGAIEHRKRLPQRTAEDQREATNEQSLLAMTLAQLQRPAEARAVIDPVLKYHRSLHARNHQEHSQHVQLAAALYASALAHPDQAPALIGEARATLDKLPNGMRTYQSVAKLRERIAEGR